nr:putative reverse transcriptase domain-containing protein [Tanacetum cinerariifolium]
MHDGFIFKGNQLCIPDSSFRLQIIKELHGEGHVGRDRTLQLVQASYFWPTMRKEVDRYVKRDVYRLHGLPSSIVSERDTRQTEVVNRSLGNLLRCLVGDHVSSSVPKKVQDFVAGLHDVHKAVRDNLVRANSKYKQDADQKRRHIGPLEIVEKMNSNAYRLKLPSHIRCSDVFNVKHLLPYHGNSSDEDSVGNSRMKFVYPGGNDVNPSIEERTDLFLEAQDH